MNQTTKSLLQTLAAFSIFIANFFVIAMVFFCFLFFAPIFSEDLDFYESTLEKSYHLFLEKKFQKAEQKLEILESREYEKDWRFYSIRGEIFLAQNKTTEAIENFTISITLNQTNSELFKRLFELHQKDKKYSKAFDYARLYLSQNPNDPKLRYKTLLLAKRLGEKEYAQFALKKLANSSLDKKEIQSEIEKLLLEKKNKEAEEKIEIAIYNFPEEETLHLHRRNLHAKNKAKLEEIYLDSAVIFSEQEKYILYLANYYKESKKFYKALNLYRKIFSLELKKKDSLDLKDSILFLRNIYFKMNRSDFLAFDELENFKEDESLLEKLKTLSITYPYNREVFLLGIHFSKKRSEQSFENYFREKLKLRDGKKSDEEFLNVYSLFLNEEN